MPEPVDADIKLFARSISREDAGIRKSLLDSSSDACYVVTGMACCRASGLSKCAMLYLYIYQDNLCIGGL
jgi:hypothetical protein